MQGVSTVHRTVELTEDEDPPRFVPWSLNNDRGILMFKSSLIEFFFKFHINQPAHEKRENLHCMKISHYTVICHWTSFDSHHHQKFLYNLQTNTREKFDMNDVLHCLWNILVLLHRDEDPLEVPILFCVCCNLVWCDYLIWQIILHRNTCVCVIVCAHVSNGHIWVPRCVWVCGGRGIEYMYHRLHWISNLLYTM